MSAFHDHITKHLFKGSLPDWQRDPVDRLVAAGLRRDRTLEETAYVLATAFWETGRFRHKEEVGKGAGRDYGESVLVYRGVRTVFYGRGAPQLTWLGNYARMSVILSLIHGKEIDLVNNPELAIVYSHEILWEGMIRGSFTGRNLADYFGPDHVDYVGARMIVNGTDKDEEIAAIAEQFEAALHLLDADPQEVSPCPLNRTDCQLHRAVMA